MSHDNEQESSSRTDPGLDGMPNADRKDTEQILNELDAEAQKGADPEKPEAKKPEEGKPETEEKPTDEGKKPDEGDKKPEKRREVKLMPAFIHETAKSQWEKREKDLQDQIEVAKRGTAEKKENGDSEKKPDSSTPVDQKKIDALVEKHGITAELAIDLYHIAAENAGKLPPEIAQQLKDVGEFRNQQAIATEAAAFSADFDKAIVPLIKAEYGDDVSPDVIAGIRENLKGLAYTPDFAKVPYDVLYKGNDQFRGMVAPKKKGAEGARGGHQQSVDAGKSGEDGELDLSTPLSDDAIRGLTDKQFEEYEKNMANIERESRKK